MKLYFVASNKYFSCIIIVFILNYKKYLFKSSRFQIMGNRNTNFNYKRLDEEEEEEKVT